MAKKFTLPKPVKPEFKALDFLNQVLTFSPKEPITPRDMEERLAIYDKIEAAGPGGIVVLDDNEHSTLDFVTQKFPYNVGTRDVLNMIKAIHSAESVPNAPARSQ